MNEDELGNKMVCGPLLDDRPDQEVKLILAQASPHAIN